MYTYRRCWDNPGGPLQGLLTRFLLLVVSTAVCFPTFFVVFLASFIPGVSPPLLSLLGLLGSWGFPLLLGFPPYFAPPYFKVRRDYLPPWLYHYLENINLFSNHPTNGVIIKKYEK